MRLIDADALYIEIMDRGIDGLQLDDYSEIQQVVADAPTVDAVPVVRCKDCLYGSENGFICGNVHGLQYAFPNAFCSNGTKRE